MSSTSGKIRPINLYRKISICLRAQEEAGSTPGSLRLGCLKTCWHHNLCACAVNRSSFVSKQFKSSDTQSVYGA